ncbi:ABC transporter substrate-binding protein [Lacinutrix sp. 5H-3-7-4]|uniref:ABC transporter substrate-binding protein n=1 Tax=Lacinutrix sp. (strain 5H-3-7-4) TaxID=983544 RepID=UPI00020A3369|nr:ABC transporter substrate-binding protein [Lacinutrix sp. 5H-3-7-4]AEH01842.1 ABC-type transporter, periplasmic subunit [Lacinutrix sp. 5H-3-7-4]
MIKLKNKQYSSLINYLPIACLLFLFFSCSNKKNTIDDTLVFRYNEHKNIGSLDPAFAKDNADIWAVNQLFDGLVQMDDNLNAQPSIAKRWSISNDALTYSFSLRDDVYFHKHKLFGKDSTRTVTARDFEYSLFRNCDEKLASPGSWVVNNIWDIKAVKKDSLVIILKSTDPSFLGKLSMKYCAVVPQEIVKHYGTAFRANPIGTGPFKFKRWEENIKLVFRKNNNYFEYDENGVQLPYLEAIAITFLPDKQSEFLQFIQGNLDFLNSLDASYQDDILTSSGILRKKYSNNINMLRGPYLNTEYLAFYLDSNIPEVQSQLIRQAINYGFDRKKMMTYLRNGIGIPANGGFIPKGLPGYNANIGFKYNPEKAKLLINEYKKESNNKTPEITITTTGNYLNFCEYIQRELQKTGLIVNVDVVPASTLKSAKANGKLDFFRASWVADYPDAQNYLSLYYSGNFAPNGPNYTHFKNSTFDKWYAQSFLETNTRKRELLYTKMDSLIMSKTPVVPLYYDEAIRFTKKEVKGLTSNPINLLKLKYVSKL